MLQKSKVSEANFTFFQHLNLTDILIMTYKINYDFEVSIPQTVGWNNSETGYSADSQWENVSHND